MTCLACAFRHIHDILDRLLSFDWIIFISLSFRLLQQLIEKQKCHLQQISLFESSSFNHSFIHSSICHFMYSSDKILVVQRSRRREKAHTHTCGLAVCTVHKHTEYNVLLCYGAFIVFISFLNFKMVVCVSARLSFCWYDVCIYKWQIK